MFITLKKFNFLCSTKKIVVYTKLFVESIKVKNQYLHFRCQNVFKAPSVFFSVETGSKWLFEC